MLSNLSITSHIHAHLGTGQDVYITAETVCRVGEEVTTYTVYTALDTVRTGKPGYGDTKAEALADFCLRNNIPQCKRQRIDIPGVIDYVPLQQRVGTLIDLSTFALSVDTSADSWAQIGQILTARGINTDALTGKESR